MNKTFWGTFLAVIAALVVYNFVTSYTASHVLVAGQGNGIGGSYVIQKVVGPWTNPDDVYSVYVISVASKESVGGGWDIIPDFDTEVRVVENSLRGFDGSNHNGTSDGDSDLGIAVTYVTVCAPSGLTTYEEVLAYSWSTDKKGPRWNYIGYNFHDMDDNFSPHVLTCGK